MFAVGTSIVVAIGLSALASISTTIGGDNSSNSPLPLVSEDGTAALVGQSKRIPRFIRTDRDLQAVAAAIALGSSSRSMQDILSIGSGCPGTGVLTATGNGPNIDLIASGLPSRVYSVFVYGPPLGNPVPFYDGQLCAAWGQLRRMCVRLTSMAGSAQYISPTRGSIPSRCSASTATPRGSTVET